MDIIVEQEYKLHDKPVRVRVNYSKKCVIILKGSIKTRQEFLDLYRETALLTLVNQMAVESIHGCVDGFAYRICRALEDGDSDAAYQIARSYFHQFDDYDIYLQIE